jgi:hypothetical protein
MTGQPPEFPAASPFGDIGRAGSPDAYLIDPGAGSGSDHVTRYWPAPNVQADIHRRGGSITPLYARMTSTNAGDVDMRETIAGLIALAGLGTNTGEPRRPHGDWKPAEFASRILTIIPQHAEQQCFALAEAILAALSTHNAEGWEPLRVASQAVLDRMFSTYTARNGREVGIEGDDGEKCWIVHSDDIEEMRRALAALPATPIAAGQEVGS